MCCSVLQCVAVCCSVLQCCTQLCAVSARDSMETNLQCTRLLWSNLQLWSNLHESPVQKTHSLLYWRFVSIESLAETAYNCVQHCNTLQHTATHCNTLQHTATHNCVATYGDESPVQKTVLEWLRLVGSLKLKVYFTKESYKRDDILQKRLIFLRSLLIVATPI